MLEAAGHRVEIRQNDWRDDHLRYTVRVYGTAVYVMDHADGQAYDARALQVVDAVLKAQGEGEGWKGHESRTRGSRGVTLL